MSLTSSKLNL